jgi:hypothetical protein
LVESRMELLSSAAKNERRTEEHWKEKLKAGG